MHIFEKYADSGRDDRARYGFLEKWAGRFMSSVDVTRFVVYGDPSPAARELLAPFGGTYMAPWGGFAR